MSLVAVIRKGEGAAKPAKYYCIASQKLQSQGKRGSREPSVSWGTGSKQLVGASAIKSQSDLGESCVRKW